MLISVLAHTNIILHFPSKVLLILVGRRDYNLEKWVDPYPHVVTPRIDTAMRKERGETLKILKALKGPPNFGKSMVPKISVPDDIVMELIERPPISQRVSNCYALRDRCSQPSTWMNISYLTEICVVMYVWCMCVFLWVVASVCMSASCGESRCQALQHKRRKARTFCSQACTQEGP